MMNVYLLRADHYDKAVAEADKTVTGQIRQRHIVAFRKVDVNCVEEVDTPT